jgi:hypothetical protein
VTVRLDTVTAAPGVTILAFEVLVNGNVSTTVVGRSASRNDGAFDIDVGRTPRVQLVFIDGNLRTTLEKLVGTSPVTGLNVIVPDPRARRCEPVPCHPSRRRFRLFRCCSTDVVADATLTAPFSSETPFPRTAVAANRVEMRLWVHCDGKCTARAAYLHDDGMRAFFRREDGRITTTELRNLSANDLAWIADNRTHNHVAVRSTQ